MSKEVLLSDLCAICHVNAIKYTCPRCGIHTCSLPCVKKHKARASCSGVRNPAEYRKRTDLATPSSIDKDFNFISGLERSLARVDEDIHDRGINFAPARQPKAHDARPKVEIEIEERGVKVIRAPKGMSRSKQNKTHWVNQQKSIMWTIEWICQDGEKVIGSCLEKRTIAEAYTNVVGKKKLKRKRKVTQPESPATSVNVKHVKQEVITSLHDQSPAVATDNDASAVVEEGDKSAAVATAKSELSNDILTGLHFYLYNTTTSSKHKCLIPISRNDAINTVLEGRTLIEFPTIYAMLEDPTQLQAPFISSEEYEKQHGAEIPINVVSSLEDGEIGDPETNNVPLAVDSTKVMEMLAKDLTA